MTKKFYSLLMAAAVCVAVAACNNGDYVANPSSNGNNTVNPLNPLDSAGFNWGATAAEPMSAFIDGSGWVAKNVSWYLDDTTGADVVVGVNGLQTFSFSLYNAYAGHIYSLGHNVKTTWGSYGVVDTAHPLNSSIFYSYNGNSGEIQILENDLSHIKALFYFQGVSPNGSVTNISKGYFNVPKY